MFEFNRVVIEQGAGRWYLSAKIRGWLVVWPLPGRQWQYEHETQSWHTEEHYKNTKL